MFSEYVLILVWVGFMAVMSNSANVKKYEMVNGKMEIRHKLWFAILVFAPVVWMAGHRGHFGDTGAYLNTFLGMPDSLSDIPQYVAANVTKDKGYYIFACIIKAAIGNNTTLYLLILAAIQASCLMIVYRKYSTDFTVSVFLFLASADYYSWMFNGIRQFTAVTIVFAATSLMLKRKYVLLLAVILFASTFHQTALLMIPIVLIAQGKAWNKRTLLFLGMAILAVAFIGQFTNWMDDALASTQYANVVSDYTSWNDDGTSPLRVAVYCVPALLAFAGRKTIAECDDPLINMCTNMSLVTAGLYLISMFTSGIFIGRLPIYASLYNYILLPWELNHMFADSTGKLLKYAMVAFYLMFYYYQMHIAWGAM